MRITFNVVSIDGLFYFLMIFVRHNVVWYVIDKFIFSTCFENTD
jgi:hypothetical protein